MTKLAEYIQWVGDLDFDAYPFRDADALVKEYKETNEGWL